MVIALVLLPNFEILTPKENISIGFSLCSHSNNNGKSPVGATQDILTESPSLAGSVPKLNGAIFGGT